MGFCRVTGNRRCGIANDLTNRIHLVFVLLVTSVRIIRELQSREVAIQTSFIAVEKLNATTRPQVLKSLRQAVFGELPQYRRWWHCGKVNR